MGLSPSLHEGLSQSTSDEIGTVPFSPLGWRGNQTGLFPDCTAPTEWSLVSTGPAEGMQSAATLPADGGSKDVVPVVGGLLTKWLVIGPFAVKNGTADFAKELIPGEARLSPKPGDQRGRPPVETRPARRRQR